MKKGIEITTRRKKNMEYERKKWPKHRSSKVFLLVAFSFGFNGYEHATRRRTNGISLVYVSRIIVPLHTIEFEVQLIYQVIGLARLMDFLAHDSNKN